MRPPLTAEDRARATAGIELLAKAFPHCFAVYQGKRRPLKIGIHLDIVARLPNGRAFAA